MSKERIRWRLILGEEAQCDCELDAYWQQVDTAIDFLYGREKNGARKSSQGQKGGDGDSVLEVPDWINQIHTLFPQQVIERLEKDAIERYQIEDIITDLEVLKRSQPNPTLLKAILRTKHLMNQEVLALARNMVRKVVQDLLDKMQRQIQSSFRGKINRSRRSFHKVHNNFDAQKTIKRNLKNYSPDLKALIIKEPYFSSRTANSNDKWHIIICVDQSGSMLDSVIHSAVTASIFWGIRSLESSLVVFDTNIVDLSCECSDPVETLMKVQLGGGTDIGGALSYCQSLVHNPRKTIVILVTDFYEGGSERLLLGTTKELIESGVTVLGLAALDPDCTPCYCETTARRMVELGAHIGAMTPGELAEWLAEKVGL